MKITAEMTYRIIDAIAFAVVGMGAKYRDYLADDEIEALSRAMAAQYCRGEGLDPDYSMTFSPLDAEEEKDEDDEEDTCEDYDEDEEEDEDEGDKREVSLHDFFSTYLNDYFKECLGD